MRSASVRSSGVLFPPPAPCWPEATVIAQPKKNQAEPVVLVRRHQSDLVNSRGDQLVYLPGPSAISLFTGAGGMDIGMEAAGFCTLVQHEWEPAACATLIANRPTFFRHAALIQGDLHLTPTSMLLREAGLRVGEPYLVCGGPPCQGFSTSNSKSGSGAYDKRNDLVFEFLRVIREAQPQFFIMENVAGFVSFPGKRDGKTYMAAFLDAAHAAYYELVYGLLDAVEYGVPQHRTRFICMGTRRDLFQIDGTIASLPKPTHFSPQDSAAVDALRNGLFGPDVALIDHAPGIRYFPDRPVLTPPRPTSDGQRSIAFLEFYRNLQMREPDRIVTRPKEAVC